MKPKMIWANFSVSDVRRSQEFYSALGFKPNNTNGFPGLTSFVFADNGLIIHFFEKGTQIDKYISSAINGEIIFSLSAQSEAEVQQWSEKVKQAGGTIFQEAGRDEAGYYGLGFADPDGHKFNVLLIEAGM